jgi:CRISPR-associated protein Csd1
MSLNSESTIPAYVLGRLFAVLEKTQREAMNSETTIKDRYFTTACASPASVFPMLLKLSQYYLIRAKFGSMHDNQIGEILNLLDVENNPIPAHLSLDEQGIFVMGYYHQRKTLSTPEDTGLHTHQHQPESIEARSLIAA